MKYDLIIIGSGPAGLTAAIYASRYKLNVLILGQMPGGIAGTAHEIHNFPSYKSISGFELVSKMIQQTNALGVSIIQEVVEKISNKGDEFEVKTNKKTYICKKLILATGTQRRELGLPGEKELVGKGVSYCATCDSGFYKDKIVAVIGGGNSALTASLLLSNFAKKVYVIYRKNEFKKAEPVWVDEINKKENIEIMFNTEVKEIFGKEKLEKIKLSNEKELEIDGLFIEIGSVPNTKLAEELNLELKKGSIVVDKTQKTNVSGVFAAGDVTNNSLKQIITACSDGAIASDSAYKELRKS